MRKGKPYVPTETVRFPAQVCPVCTLVFEPGGLTQTDWSITRCTRQTIMVNNRAELRAATATAMASPGPQAAHGASSEPQAETHRGKLTEAQVLEIRALYKCGGQTHRQIAERYGVTRTTIGYIIAGHTWSDLKESKAA
jgi:hypothetical protein